MPIKTEKELKELGFIHLYIVSDNIHVYGKDKERYYCENGIVKYHNTNVRAVDEVDFVW